MGKTHILRDAKLTDFGAWTQLETKQNNRFITDCEYRVIYRSPPGYLKLANLFEFSMTNFNQNNRIFWKLDRGIHIQLEPVDNPTNFHDFNRYRVSLLFTSNQKLVWRFQTISTTRMRLLHIHILRSKYIYRFKINKIYTIESSCANESANKRQIKNFFNLKVTIK